MFLVMKASKDLDGQESTLLVTPHLQDQASAQVGMFPGIVESADGEWLYLYMWGTAATHHVQGHCPDMWGNKCVPLIR